MTALRPFLDSPLGRHPRLLVRKAASRLGLYRENVPVPAPAVSAAVHPAHWAPALRDWLQQVPLHPAPHPFGCVFGHDFDEEMLLRLCEVGPQPDAHGLTADPKLIWDYSRAQPLFTNAAAGPAHLEACAGFLRRWLAANANTNGPAWSCAMDVAIRAVNWIFADALFGGALGRKLGQKVWAGWLWQHGWLIWRRLEARIVSSNHYLADLLGLFIVGAVFPDDPQAQTWRRFAERDFPRALLKQTRGDGGLNEASLRYHAFVTEMALLFRLAQGFAFPAETEMRLQAMCRIIADFRDATGDVFAIGDDDSGRVLALDSASPSGRAEILLRLAARQLGKEFPTSTSAVYPESGWWVKRSGDFAVALDFGGVGLHGGGAHAHNDDFSFCLDWRAKPVITDPGSFLYTSDRAARNRFRSTLSHNSLRIDEREQHTLSDEPFMLLGPDVAFDAAQRGENAWAFTRPMMAGLIHRREIAASSGEISICDSVEGAGQHQLEWRFNLHPSVCPSLARCGFTLDVPGAGRLLLQTSEPTLALEILPSEYSPSYGRSHMTHVCVVRSQSALPCSVVWSIRAVE